MTGWECERARRLVLTVLWACAFVSACPVLAHGQSDKLVLMPPWADESLERPNNGYWSEGLARWFIATRCELGPPYVKPYVSFGYGMPHWFWTGVDVNAIATMDMVQAYFGVRAASPLLDLAVGIRDTYSFARPFLPLQERYDHDDVNDAPGSQARYWAWEAEGVALLPLPYSGIGADFIAVRTIDVPAEHALYDESYRVVVDQPLFFDLRVGAVARVLREGALKFGAVGEYLFDTGRGSTLRLGGAIMIQLTDHLEANATVTVPVRSPDRLGLVLGSYAAAGLRYRTATGEKNPEPPWGGHVIPW
jgi:hypothetical protein